MPSGSVRGCLHLPPQDWVAFLILMNKEQSRSYVPEGYNGYVSISYDFIDSHPELLSDAKLMALLLVLLRHTPFKDSFEWKRGVLETSQSELLTMLGWKSHNTLSDKMRKLVQLGLIEYETDVKEGTMIRFVDYDALTMKKSMSKNDILNGVSTSKNDILNGVSTSKNDILYNDTSNSSSDTTCRTCSYDNPKPRKDNDTRKMKSMVDKFIREDLGVYSRNIIDLTDDNLSEVRMMRQRMVTLGGYMEDVKKCDAILSSFRIV